MSKWIMPSLVVNKQEVIYYYLLLYNVITWSPLEITAKMLINDLKCVERVVWSISSTVDFCFSLKFQVR